MIYKVIQCKTFPEQGTIYKIEKREKQKKNISSL